MAPMLRLANEIVLGVESRHANSAIAARLSRFEKKVHSAPFRVASHFRRLLAAEDRPFVQTLSYGSTVLKSLMAAKKMLYGVWCAESRPANEGRKMAKRLAAAGIRVCFSTDACMFGQLGGSHIVLLGSDAVLPGWIAGKVGIKAIVHAAAASGCRVFFAVDTTKFWRDESGNYPRWEWTFGPEKEVWSNPPRNVDVYNLYFELVPYRKDSRIRFITEHGLMTPARVRREVAKIKISPRLKELLD